MDFFTRQRVLPRFNNANLDNFKIVPNTLWRCIPYLLTSYLFAMSAPLPSSSGKPFWVNPCKMEASYLDDNTVSSTSIEDLFDEIINNSNVCYLQSRDVKNHLLQRLDGVEEESLQDQKYEWLQSPILEPGHFETLDRNDALKGVYFLLQKFAVAIDQMVTDQSDKEDYTTLLLATKYNLIQVLCSLQLSMISLDVKPHPDATHDILGVELRTLSESGKLLRDFIVIRELHLTAQYTKEMVKFFKGN